MLNEKPPASIQVDLDGLWAVLDHLGYKVPIEQDPLYRRALPRFISLFEKYGVRATIFVVGKDLTVSWKAKLLESLVERGHEIANHSYSHPSSFGRLPDDPTRFQIEKSENMIKETLGVRPVGFRAPHFAVNTTVLKILQDQGYFYDSSLFPTSLAPFLRSIKSLLAGRRLDPACYMPYWGIRKFPMKPYRPSQNNFLRAGKMAVWEIPVTTFPFLQIPFHASYVLAVSELVPSLFFFKGGLSMLKKMAAPVIYLFHLSDLADSVTDARLKGHPGFHLDHSRKWALCSRILEILLARYQAVTTAELLDIWTKGETSDSTPT